MEAKNAIKDIRQSLHELAQPLAAVTGLVDLLLLQRKVDAGLQSEIQLISDRLEKVIIIIGHIREIIRAASLTEADDLGAKTSLQPHVSRFTGM